MNEQKCALLESRALSDASVYTAAPLFITTTRHHALLTSALPKPPASATGVIQAVQPWIQHVQPFPRPVLAARTCTLGDNSISGKLAGCVAGRCRNSILDTMVSMEERLEAAMPSSTPMVVGSCCSLRYLCTAHERGQTYLQLAAHPCTGVQQVSKQKGQAQACRLWSTAHHACGDGPGFLHTHTQTCACSGSFLAWLVTPPLGEPEEPGYARSLIGRHGVRLGLPQAPSII